MQEQEQATERFEDSRGLRWCCLRGRRELLLRHVSPLLPPQEAEAQLRTLKRSKRRQVWALAAPDAPAMVVKRYPGRRRFPDSLRDRLRTRSRDEFEIGVHLWNGGFATPTPLAYAERWHRGRIQESYYILQELRGAQALGPWLESRFEPGDGSGTKLRWIARAGATLDRLHNTGLYHRDFHGGNLLLREAEGPAGRLFLIDFPVALRLGFVPRHLRAKDFADLLYSLRHVLDEHEEKAIVERLATGDVDPTLLTEALQQKKRRARHDRLQRAFRSSSQFAVERHNGWVVHRDRDLDEERVKELIASHAAALRDADSRVMRIGGRSRLSMHLNPPLQGVVVKEYLPTRGSARRRAREAWRGGVALQVADLPTARPLALILGRKGEASWVMNQALPHAIPLHLYAHRVLVGPAAKVRVRRIAERVADLLVGLIRAEVHHPDLSLKNLLVVAPNAERPVVNLVDWDGVRPRRGWTEGRLVRALAQLGDLPEANFGLLARARFVRDLLTRLGAPGRHRSILRLAAARLHKRRKSDRFVGSTP